MHLVVGPDILAPAPSKWNNIPWGLHANPILIFRQISPKEDFYKSFNAVEIAFDENSSEIDLRNIYADEEEKIASTAIGEWAPSGKYCTIGDFLRNRCDF